ncbi:MAG: preprotein translocase subunit SecA, partial [Clostridiales bacterium]|nr:preprotein translocase subunit SecA [Clostridiales bacterium]
MGITGIIEKIFGTYSDKEIKRIIPIVDKIEALEPEMKRLSDAELKAKTAQFKRRIAEGETLDDLLPEAYAVVREAGVRAIGQRIFRVQLIGGVVLFQGRVAEMHTGEGKTLTCVCPAYLHALMGKGVHIVTVNEYLAKYQGEWMGHIYAMLDMQVGVIFHDLNPEERRAAYNCDITYCTNNELGFDYLRDNLVVYKEDQVQRELNYAIIDEADSILIDEARTPLIISGSGTKSTQLYKVADGFVKGLKKGRVINEEEAMNPLLRAEIKEEGDYVVDEKQKTTALTQEGVARAERFFAIENLSDPENLEIQHHINNALKANYNMFLDQNYVVDEKHEIVIVDEFTGRLMPGRRYSDGLHQAIEAKENVTVNRESRTLATITFQNFFNKYAKKAGMTGTAVTEEAEFREIYGMDVVVVPTNKPVIRKDMPDIVYKTEAAKYRAVVEDVADCYARKQPVLIGTITIEKSEELSKYLKKRNIPHQVLNAKYHEKEAEIVALAGQPGAVTIATNMAGRGTDIKLGPGVPELGGLKIVGTERHESRRIDNQLRGRSGRQGDPGMSRFYVALDDELMRLFGSERIKGVLGALGLKEDDPIEHKMLSNAIENAQKKVEGNNFSTRKHLLDYDRVMNEQREVIYGERKRVLLGEDLRDTIMVMMKTVIEDAVKRFAGDAQYPEDWDMKGLNEFLCPILSLPYLAMSQEEQSKLTQESLSGQYYQMAKDRYEKREKEFQRLAPDTENAYEKFRELERIVMLQVVDKKWMDHLDDMAQMRQGISLRAFAQRDPLTEYKFLSYDMFNELSDNIKKETVKILCNMRMAATPMKREQV